MLCNNASFLRRNPFGSIIQRTLAPVTVLVKVLIQVPLRVLVTVLRVGQQNTGGFPLEFEPSGSTDAPFGQAAQLFRPSSAASARESSFTGRWSKVVSGDEKERATFFLVVMTFFGETETVRTLVMVLDHTSTVTGSLLRLGQQHGACDDSFGLND